MSNFEEYLEELINIKYNIGCYSIMDNEKIDSRTEILELLVENLINTIKEERIFMYMNKKELKNE
jgi:hypothetical protein